ncbi:hypothetical protein ABT364_24925 [Massilia sp. SR12]
MFDVDGMAVHAFFNPPSIVADQFSEEDVGMLALPLACHMAADVRPHTLSMEGPGSFSAYDGVLRSALAALLLEQDVYWQRRNSTSLPDIVWQGLEVNRSKRNRLDPRTVILGFSGGKDSLVCLFSLLEAGFTVYPLLLNEGDRTWQDLRRWIPRLRGLGLQPLTAYLRIDTRPALRRKYGKWHRSSYQIGWLTSVLALVAEKMGAAVICLGLEGSADRSGIICRDRIVNHQHQKTTDHMQQLQDFFRQAVHPKLSIGSPIAPFSDARILQAMFTGLRPRWRHFSSCGSSNSQSKHCCACDKCAYIFALLARTKKGRALARHLFRRDLFEDIELYRPWLDKRYRAPFACVGERWELWAALEEALNDGGDSPVLAYWRQSPFRSQYHTEGHASLPLHEAALAAPVRSASKVVARWAGLPST